MATMVASSVPLYSRIQETLRVQIASGRFAPGERLPSEAELARSFATTRMTVRQALARLTFEGLIIRRMGSGTFVANHRVEGRIEAQRPQSFEEQMTGSGARVTFRLLGFDGERASSLLAESLSVPEGDLIYRLRRLRLVDENIISFEERWILARIGSAVPAPALACQSVITFVEAALGTPLGGIKVAVAAVPVPSEVARLLEVQRSSPVLVLAHTFFDQDGRPIVVGDSVYRGDKYRFTYKFGRSET